MANIEPGYISLKASEIVNNEMSQYFWATELTSSPATIENISSDESVSYTYTWNVPIYNNGGISYQYPTYDSNLPIDYKIKIIYAKEEEKKLESPPPIIL